MIPIRVKRKLTERISFPPSLEWSEVPCSSPPRPFDSSPRSVKIHRPGYSRHSPPTASKEPPCPDEIRSKGETSLAKWQPTLSYPLSRFFFFELSLDVHQRR